MSTPRTLMGPILVCSALGAGGPAAAVAIMGGSVALGGGNGACNVNATVPLTTPQDNFLLSRATGCAGTNSSAQLRGNAATASVGLRAASSGNGLGSSQVAAQVYLADQWQISVPAGTPLGPITLPVSLHLEGSISPAAVVNFPFFGRFLDYFMNIGGYLGAAGVLQANGSIVTTGAFAQTFNANLTWQHTGQPLRAAIEMSLFMPGLNEGVLDFYNSAAASILLPPGYSATTSSGLPLVFAPVPEPSPAALLLAGLAWLGLWRRAGPRWRGGRSTRNDRPVFTLPAGYTVNSADAGIVNNTFSTPVPGPASGLLAALGLLAIGSWARRRRGAAAAALSLVPLLAAAPARAEVRFTVTNLGTLGGTSSGA